MYGSLEGGLTQSHWRLHKGGHAWAGPCRVHKAPWEWRRGGCPGQRSVCDNMPAWEQSVLLPSLPYVSLLWKATTIPQLQSHIWLSQGQLIPRLAITYDLGGSAQRKKLEKICNLGNLTKHMGRFDGLWWQLQPRSWEVESGWTGQGEPGAIQVPQWEGGVGCKRQTLRL